MQAIGEFLEWLLNCTPYEICEYRGQKPVFCNEDWSDSDIGKEAETIHRLRVIQAELSGEEPPEKTLESNKHPNLCKCGGTGLVWRETDEFLPVQKGIQWWLAQYFEIDQQAMEREKMAVLEHIRSSNGP